MLVHLIDPSSFTPPYDDALAGALSRQGAQVQLFSSRHSYGAVPEPRGYARLEYFYRIANRRAETAARRGSKPPGPIGPPAPMGPRPAGERAIKAAEHLPEMIGYSRRALSADIAHFQWLPLQPLDLLALRYLRYLRSARSKAASASAPRPRLLLTAHDIMPREPWPGQHWAQRRLFACFDALVTHSRAGARRLIEDLGLPPERVHVIAHGVLHPAADAPSADARAAGRPARLPAGFRPGAAPVVLFFGLLRPYKGLDVLIEAWRKLKRELAGAGDRPGADSARAAQLWIAGMPRMDLSQLFAELPPDVSVHLGYLSDAELASLLDQASLVVLPYRQIDASGAAFTALGAGLPLVLSDAGGFPEIAEAGAARTVPAGDADALAEQIGDLLCDPEALGSLRAGAKALAGGRYDWDSIGRMTMALYEELLEESDR